MDTVRLFGHHVHGRTLLLGITQGLLAFGCVYGAWLFSTLDLPFLGEGGTSPHLQQAVTFVAVIMLCMMSVGLYQVRLRDSSARILARILLSFGMALLVIAVVSLVFPPLYLGRELLAMSLLLALLAVSITHILFFGIIDQGMMKRRILFYGAGDRATRLLSRLRRKSDQRLFKLMGCVSLPNEVEGIRPEHLIHLEKRLVDYVHEHRIDEVVVAMDERRGRFPSDELLSCRLSGVEVTNMLGFYERHTGKIKCDLLQPSDIIFADGFKQSDLWDAVKRSMDIAAALVLLIPAVPLILLAGLAIKLEEGWQAPIFYRQTRVGQGNRLYEIVKMRSMCVDAEQPGEAQWATRNDDRVTRVGASLRKYRIDELPQLFNVLRGEMSLVGPRPERPEFVEQLAENLQFYTVRHRVKPGITGWAQLCYPYGSSQEDSLQKLQYDLYYVKNGSIFLDLVILLGTVEVILFRKGAR